MSIRLRLLLLLLASVSSLLLLLFGAAVWVIRNLGKGLQATTAEEMSGQAEQLQQLMSFFTLADARPANPLTTHRESAYGSA